MPTDGAGSTAGAAPVGPAYRTERRIHITRVVWCVYAARITALRSFMTHWYLGKLSSAHTTQSRAQVQVPTLSKLAARSTVFANAWVQAVSATACAPHKTVHSTSEYEPVNNTVLCIY